MGKLLLGTLIAIILIEAVYLGVTLVTEVSLQVLILIEIEFQIIGTFTQQGMVQAVSIIEVASYRMRMAQGESALLTIVEYQTLVLLVETDHLDLIGRMYHCQLTILASLVYNTIGERDGWLITNGDFCNFFIHHLFAVYTKQDCEYVLCSGRNVRRPT